MVTQNAIDLNGTGIPVYNGAGTFSATTTTQHAVLAGGASNAIANIGPLTNGQLVIGSTGVAPVAASLTSTGGTVTITPGAGSINLEATSSAGSLVLIQTQNANNSASITFTTGITYNNYMLFVDNCFPVTNGSYLWIQVSTDGGGTYLNSGYKSGNFLVAYNNNVWGNNNSTAAFQISSSTDNSAAGRAMSGVYTLLNMTSATAGVPPTCIGQCLTSNADNPYYVTTTGWNTTAAGSSVNAIKVLFATGNISTGKFSLYGIVQ